MYDTISLEQDKNTIFYSDEKGIFFWLTDNDKPNGKLKTKNGKFIDLKVDVQNEDIKLYLYNTNNLIINAKYKRFDYSDIEIQVIDIFENSLFVAENDIFECNAISYTNYMDYLYEYSNTKPYYLIGLYSGEEPIINDFISDDLGIKGSLSNKTFVFDNSNEINDLSDIKISVNENKIFIDDDVKQIADIYTYCETDICNLIESMGIMIYSIDDLNVKIDDSNIKGDVVFINTVDDEWFIFFRIQSDKWWFLNSDGYVYEIKKDQIS